MLGVLYAGCPYAPLDAGMPAERLQTILDQLQSAAILRNESTYAAVGRVSSACPVLLYEEAVKTCVDDTRLSAIRAQDSVYDILSYVAGTTAILEVDGLKFKDLNKNGALDVYEDWRKTDDKCIADLLSRMTPEEKIGGLLTYNVDLAQAAADIKEFHITNLLFNLNGTPDVVATQLNNLQHTAEGTRLGIPMIFSSDREYNAFGGYIDKAHNAFGNANDPELAYQLAYYYGQAMTPWASTSPSSPTPMRSAPSTARTPS